MVLKRSQENYKSGLVKNMKNEEVSAKMSGAGLGFLSKSDMSDMDK